MTNPPARPYPFLVFLALALLLASLIWSVLAFFAPGVDGAVKQREYFGDAPLPFGLQLVAASRLSGDQPLLRFARAGKEGAGPEELLLIEYSDHGAVEPLFRGPGGMDGGPGTGGMLASWERDKAFAWHCTMKRGEIAWGALSTKLQIERAFQKGGGWNDQARVDLSSGERALVLFATWPLEHPAEEDELRAVLDRVKVKPNVAMR